MISSYSKDTGVYTCEFTREEFNTLIVLVCAGVCSYHGVESFHNMEEYRRLRNEIYYSYEKP